MKVFFDDKPLSEGHAIRGIGSYTRNLLDELRKIKSVDLVDSVQEADVVHYPYFDLFFNTLKLIDKPTIVTIYDVIPLLYPQYYQPGIKGKINFNSQKSKLNKADAIVTISETSKKDIVRLLDVPVEKIFVTYLAPGESFRKMENGKWKIGIKKRYGLPDRFALYVGDVNYNKNIPNLIKSCEIAGLPLVIAGKQAVEIERNLALSNFSGPRDWARYVFNMPHPEHAHFKELGEEFSANENVMRLGFVPDEDLVGIYNLAAVYCQPSLYEGFGLPVLEAMACGCPVVASKTQTLVEIAEDFAIFVDPKNPNSIAKGLQEVTRNKNLKEKLIKEGLVHAKKFTWEKTAKSTFEIYQNIFKE